MKSNPLPYNESWDELDDVYRLEKERDLSPLPQAEIDRAARAFADAAAKLKKKRKRRR